MSLLSDTDITRCMEAKKIAIAPFAPASLGPASYDVRLDRFIRRPRREPGEQWENKPLVHQWIDLANVPPDHTELVEIDADSGYALYPGDFILGSTVELVTVGREFAARFEGRSSIGRLGLATHVTAGFIDPGFSGHVTLEIVNHSPWNLIIYPGMRIGQLGFFRMSRMVERPYGMRGHYQGQSGPTESRFALDPVLDA